MGSLQMIRSDSRTPPRRRSAHDRTFRLDGSPPEPVFIVGCYKCGTSWLLAALSAHPRALGIREVDPVFAARTAFGEQPRWYQRIWDFRRVIAPTAGHRAERITQAFLSESAWCPQDFLKEVQLGKRHGHGERDDSRPQSFRDLDPEVAMSLYRRLQRARRPEDAMDAFLDAVSSEPRGATHLVLKSAKQLSVFDDLQAWQPHAKKLAIVRDGRDAAISAVHYEHLMRERKAPWFRNVHDYWVYLKNWTRVVQLVRDRVHRGQLRAIRYEDLTSDFVGTLTPVLHWLGLEHSRATIEAIDAQTSFEAKTGRPRGTESKAVLRRGAIREWKETLSDREKEQAWSLAGDQLEAFGYTKHGDIEAMP